MQKLRWIRQRTQRIYDSASAHFGRHKVQDIFLSLPFRANSVDMEKSVSLLAQSQSIEQFLTDLGFNLQFDEALLVTELRRRASPFPEHVQEQILFGAKHAGQDCGRIALKQGIPDLLDPLRAAQIVEHFVYSRENTQFTSARPFGHITVHHERSTQVEPWLAAGADLALMDLLFTTWIGGILDVVAPHVLFQRTKSLARGDAYGIDHYCIKAKSDALNSTFLSDP